MRPGVAMHSLNTSGLEYYNIKFFSFNIVVIIKQYFFICLILLSEKKILYQMYCLLRKTFLVSIVFSFKRSLELLIEMALIKSRSFGVHKRMSKTGFDVKNGRKTMYRSCTRHRHGHRGWAVLRVCDRKRTLCS